VAGNERRRFRTCHSCWSDRVIRSSRVDGVTVSVGPLVPDGPVATAPLYANVCRECGMVMLFVRLAEAEPPTT